MLLQHLCWRQTTRSAFDLRCVARVHRFSASDKPSCETNVIVQYADSTARDGANRELWVAFGSSRSAPGCSAISEATGIFPE
jgi:hypothetical protein